MKLRPGKEHDDQQGAEGKAQIDQGGDHLGHGEQILGDIDLLGQGAVVHHGEQCLGSGLIEEGKQNIAGQVVQAEIFDVAAKQL